MQLDTRFSIRYLLAARPLSAATLFYFASVGAFSYFMKVCERPLCYLDWAAQAPANWCADVTKSNNETWNSFWLVIITSLTVGYGDMYPFTHLGRCVAICCAIMGICLIALVVNAVQQFVRLDVQESLATTMLQAAALAARRKALAAAVVQRFLRFAARQLRGSPRRLYIKRMAAATFLWPRTGAECAAGWLPWRKLSDGARKRLLALPLNSVGRELRAPLAAAIEAWRRLRVEAAVVARKRDALEVLEDKVAALQRTLTDLALAFGEAHPELKARHAEHAEKERAEALSNRVARAQNAVRQLAGALPGFPSEERARLQRDADAAIARGVAGLPHGFLEREARAKLAAAAAERALDALDVAHYNPMLSARALAALQP